MACRTGNGIVRRSALHWLVVALCLLLAPGALTAQQVTIYRDRFGVPSVAADRLPDAMFGLGYAMAQDNAEQMARNFKQARGRRAEVDGQSALLTDTFLRALGFEERAERSAATLPSESALIVRRFCDGANRALAEHKAPLPDWIEPFTPVDVLALAQLAQAAFPLQEIAAQLLPGAGSNQFAVAPKRSATGHAILSIDPHLLWSGPLLWYEYTVYCRDFNFHGVTLSGLPLGTMGHTDRVAWSMTNNNPRLYDFVTIKTNPANAKQYSYHGEWRDFEELPLEMRYRENGLLKARRLTVRRTAWGPMAPLRAQAVRLAMPEIPAMFRQALAMSRARTAAEFRRALQARGLSMWNIVYADTLGHIGYQYNANLPKRAENVDWTKPVPGADPQTKWTGYWPLDALPHAEDPASGLLINSNSAPWVTTLGKEIPSTGWPSYVTSYSVTTRYERLAALLTANARVTVSDAKSIATDTLVPYARAAVRALAAAAQRAGAASDATASDGMKVLAAWDGRADVSSRGCGLYLYWMRAEKAMPELARRAAHGEAWSVAENDAATAAFASACRDMTAQHGRLDAPWGELHVSMRGGRTEPVSGLGYFAPGDATATVTPNFGPFRDGRIVCDGGSSFRMIVSLDPKGVRSWSALPYGNSQDPSNPHYADQQAMFGRGEYKDTLYGLSRIRKPAASHLTLRTE
jgi:acyl-homoserine-lactone acylase